LNRNTHVDFYSGFALAVAADSLVVGVELVDDVLLILVLDTDELV